MTPRSDCKIDHEYLTEDLIMKGISGQCPGCGKKLNSRELDLSDEEILGLWKLLAHEFISHDNIEGIKAVRKISDYVEEHELGPTSS